MELIIIGENRLKIMLTGEDMARYELADLQHPEESGDGVTPHTREALRHIFADARNESGFDTEGERLFVQLYASKGGGCEIFVTKLGRPVEEKLLKRIMEEDTVIKEKRERTVWLRLEQLAHVCALCRRLLSVGFRGKSALYIPAEEENGWYLSLTLREEAGESVSFPFLWEYGEESRGDLGAYLTEHGRVICSRGAVEILARI